MLDWAKLALDMPGVQPEHNFNPSCYAQFFFKILLNVLGYSFQSSQLQWLKC